MHLMLRLFLALLFLPSLYATRVPTQEPSHPYYFATSTDTEHYLWTLNLIASIHHYHKETLGEIAVFDLGLTPEERLELNHLEGVHIYTLEKTNPEMFEKCVVDKQGKIARGYYSWKPVAIKQASELFPAFFYLDSGITVMGPMDLLFAHLQSQGHLLIDCGHSLERMTIKPLIKKLSLSKKLLKKTGISAGFQGITRALQPTYVLPLYELSKDIEHFKDDGSCPKGFGWARHDQTLFSIQARLLNLTVQEVIRGGKLHLQVQGKKKKIPLSNFIKITRSDFDLEVSKKWLIKRR